MNPTPPPGGDAISVDANANANPNSVSGTMQLDSTPAGWKGGASSSQPPWVVQAGDSGVPQGLGMLSDDGEPPGNSG